MSSFPEIRTNNQVSSVNGWRFDLDLKKQNLKPAIFHHYYPNCDRQEESIIATHKDSTGLIYASSKQLYFDHHEYYDDLDEDEKLLVRDFYRKHFCDEIVRLATP